MRARLGFAIATDEMPDILLVDEVLAVGDAEFRQRCDERIENYRREGMTVLIVSHTPQTLVKMCDRMIWLDEGVVRKAGAPGDVIGAYADSIRLPSSVGAPIRHGD
jgi:ABC-type polysaccharide/polyol phosphate transport system ATPase subunit